MGRSYDFPANQGEIVDNQPYPDSLVIPLGPIRFLGGAERFLEALLSVPMTVAAMLMVAALTGIDVVMAHPLAACLASTVLVICAFAVAMHLDDRKAYKEWYSRIEFGDIMPAMKRMEWATYPFVDLTLGANNQPVLSYLDGDITRFLSLRRGPNLELAMDSDNRPAYSTALVSFERSKCSIDARPPRHIRRKALDGCFTKATLSYTGEPTIKLSDASALARLAEALR